MSLFRLSTRFRISANLSYSNCSKNLLGLNVRTFQKTNVAFYVIKSEEKIVPQKFNKEDKAHFGDLVYTGPERLTKSMAPIKLVSGFFSFNTMFLQFKAAAQGTFDITFLAPFCMILTPVSIAAGYFGHWITKRYVMEMFYNSQNEKYTAILQHYLGYPYALTFAKSDMRPPLNHAMVCSVFVSGYPLLLFDSGYLSDKAKDDISSIEYYGMDADISKQKSETTNDIKKEAFKTIGKQKIARKL